MSGEGVSVSIFHRFMSTCHIKTTQLIDEMMQP